MAYHRRVKQDRIPLRGVMLLMDDLIELFPDKEFLSDALMIGGTVNNEQASRSFENDLIPSTGKGDAPADHIADRIDLIRGASHFNSYITSHRQ